MRDLEKIAMTGTLSKVASPRGDARSMTPLTPTSVNVSYGAGTGSDWFGPSAPMRPIAPPEVAGRVWDYMPGFNLSAEPRANEPVTFAMLRTLSESYDPLRIILETRKNQMCRLLWQIHVKHDGPEKKRPSAAALSPSVRSMIRDVTEFVKHPTLELSFREFLRMVLEDHFVLDAVALHQERTYSGTLVGLQPLDGATIKRVIDDYGRTPKPTVWTGQPFMWNGQQVSAETYAAQGFKLINGFLLPPAFQQILHGLPAVSMTTHDLLYKMQNVRTHRPYGFSPVEQIVITVGAAIGRTSSQIAYTREGNQPEAIYGLPDTWNADQTQRFQDYWDGLHTGNLGARRRMKFVPAGTNSAYTALKEPPLKSEYDEWLIRIVCAAFSFPPAAFVSLQNRSIAEAHERQAEEGGLQQTKIFVADLMNQIVQEELADDSIEFSWIEEDEIDQEKQAKILTAYVSGGILTANEARERLGEEPNPNPAANELQIKTQTGDVPIDGEAKPSTKKKEIQP